MTGRIAFQGEPGAFSHLACRESHPDLDPLACPTFEDAFAAVEEGRADLAMIPVENAVAGRVADIHHLLPESPLHIVAEHFSPVRHFVLGPPGAALDAVTTIASHPMALAQARRFIRARGWTTETAFDTAGAARLVAEAGDPARAALASRLAGEICGLTVLAADVQDDPDNTTRFIALARAPAVPAPGAEPCVTSFLFRVRNVPAALYKALGGFATNGVSMTKLESYLVDGQFTAAQFYADVEGHPDDPPLKLAFEELKFFCSEFRIVGTYPAHPGRAARV